MIVKSCQLYNFAFMLPTAQNYVTVSAMLAKIINEVQKQVKSESVRSIHFLLADPFMHTPTTFQYIQVTFMKHLTAGACVCIL